MTPQKRDWCLPSSEKAKDIIQQMKMTAAGKSSFPERLPWDLTWQWGITCFHRTSPHCRAATGGITGTDVPQGYSTLPANSLFQDQQPSWVLSGSPPLSREISQPLALPVLHHQNKDDTFLAHRRKEGGIRFKEVKPRQCWALWFQKSHKVVVLVLVMVPSVGMACISTSSCVRDTHRNQTSVSCELLSSYQDDSLRC